MNRVDMNAFVSQSILDKLTQRIECIDSWECKGEKFLVIGTTEGYLLTYFVYETKDHNGNIQVSVKIRETRQISKKPISQITVFDDFNKIVTLSDGDLRIHDLMSQVGESSLLQKARGCSAYAVSYQPGLSLSLVAAVKKKLVLYAWDGSDFYEQKEFNMPDLAKNIDYRGNYIVVCFKKAYNIINTSDGSVTNVDADKLTFTTFLQNNEFLMVRGNMSFFINTGGSPVRRHSMTWMDAPSSMVIYEPFAIAVEGRLIEIQILPDPNDPKTISQSMFLQGCKSISAKKDIYVSSPSGVWRILPHPILELVDQMVTKLEYETAINLLQTTQENIPHLKERLIKIKTSAAYHLFQKEQFQTAMGYFISAQVDPLKIISLYPGLLPRHLQDKLSIPIHIRDIENNPRALPELEHYLVEFRKNKIEYQSPPELLNSGYTLQELVDTTLLKVYIKHKPSLIPHFFHLKNHCHVEESERVLLEEKKTTELILFYKSKDLHRKALTLLAKTNNNNPNDTIAYLCHLGEKHINIILDNSKWVLQKSPNEALAIFTTDRKEPLAPEEVIPHLRQYAPLLLRPYLEHIINDPVGPNKNPDYHNQLAFEYLGAITDQINIMKQQGTTRKPGAIPAGSEPAPLGPLRNRLIQFLQTSKCYLPEKMLSIFPIDDLFEERAILLSKIGRHEQALTIYAHKLKNYQMAEEYCDRHYNKDSEESRDVYLSLLNVYLKPDGQSEPLLEPALELLNKHYRSINTPKALNLLPLNTPIEKLYPFFEAVIRDNTKTKRDNQVVKNLFKSENFKIKDELSQLRSGAIKITEDLSCPICGKIFLGTQAFVAQPNGTAVHYHHKNDKQYQKYFE
ncbi:hypothetical protein DICPUDRAFT_153214 [Dictyostelium purpureum]|uniref:CNH domain-containing protein n=1 Tax=Dictyostelium purpureum TaxID=5786 RepID=F0ZNB9_DICPU|nr:uncharacterized protein DICPUDRAFT_153214 [Dictyostelium purpureum]EGC34554.1 hypothetical protein DICPUDRAFT_153214 [Dictyostelium purpureum]|eukprot:XP_003288930.1 hypothetical protein DICPUDRAFT_153214 [Dictyostelium purpureum]